MKFLNQPLKAALFLLIPGVLLTGLSGSARGQTAREMETFAGEAGLGRAAYLRVAGERLHILKETIRDLKRAAAVRGYEGRSWEEISSELDEKRRAAESKYQELQSAPDKQWSEARPGVDEALEDARSSLERTAERVLPEREAYAIKAQQRLAEFDARIEQLKAERAGAREEGEKAALDWEIGALKKIRGLAESSLNDLRADKTETWKRHRDAFERAFR